MTSAIAENRVDAIRSTPSTLRVLLASWAPFHAGAEVAAERLAIGLRDRGHTVTVVLGAKGVTSARMKAAGLDVRHIELALTDKFKWWRFTRAQRQLRRLFVELKPDVAHANDLPTSQMVGRAAAQAGVPRVCHHRWIFEADAADWLNKFGAEHHIFISRSIRSEMCDSSRTLAQSCASIVHDGMPIPALPLETHRKAARRALALPLDKRIVLFAGQLIERKGVQDLLQAWSQLGISTREKAILLIVGEDLENNGAYRAKMESLAGHLGVQAEFKGFRQNVSEWIVAADICVVPSHREPFGLSVLEAMAHGRPVIGSKIGGIPDMILDGECGLLVPPENPQRLSTAIELLVNDADRRLQFGRAARQRAEEQFSLSKHVGAVEDVYRHVLARPGSAVA